MTSTVAPTREPRLIPLDAITGRSPMNCRPESEDDDVADLVASIGANGLIYPLLVSSVPGPLVRFWVDAGGRRLAALRRLVADGKLAGDAGIACEVVNAAEPVAREISLAENIHRALHPVDQCAAFEAMIKAGTAETEIADHFALTLRQVRQSLKLTKLSPRVRALWRDGTIAKEAAQAFTVASDHAAQDALLDEIQSYGNGLDGWYDIDDAYVRSRLRGEAVRADCPDGRYVGVEAYLAAGGDIDENLFEDQPLILDAALLKRLASAKLMREGEAILAETGLSFCMVESEVESAGNWPQVEPEYLPEETARLAQIEDDDEGDQDALDREQATIERRAFSRALTPELKATTGILVSIGHDAKIFANYVFRPKDAPALGETASATPPASSGAKPKKTEKPADPIEAVAARRGVRDVLETTIAAALPRIVADRPDLALLFAVARFGGTFAPAGLVREFGLFPHDNRRKGLLGGLDAKDFDHAVAICAKAPLADLTATFAQIVAGSIRLDKHAPLGALDALMGAFARRGGALRAAFVAAIDHAAYFEAATGQAVLAALEAMATPLVDRKLKKPALAALAADEAKRKGWLPHPLEGWAAMASEPDLPSLAVHLVERADATLASAMAAAIDDDEAKKAALAAWLAASLVPTPGVEIAAGELYTRYGEAAGDGRLGIQAFGQAVAAGGIAKRRKASGTVYVDVAFAQGDAT